MTKAPAPQGNQRCRGQPQGQFAIRQHRAELTLPPMYPSGRSRPTSAGHAWINSNFRRHGAEPTANRATETKIVPESAVCSPASRTNQRLGRRLLLPARPRDRQWRWRLRAIPAIVPHGRADAGPGYCHRCQAAGRGAHTNRPVVPKQAACPQTAPCSSAAKAPSGSYRSMARAFGLTV
jgi:hypothetical protein